MRINEDEPNKRLVNEGSPTKDIVYVYMGSPWRAEVLNGNIKNFQVFDKGNQFIKGV